MYQLVLASASPRRKEILENAGFSPVIFSVKVSENLRKNLTVDEQIIDLAERKLLAHWTSFKPLKLQNIIMIAADTMVIFEQHAIGKPQDREQAKQILCQLSGQLHLVKTAVCLGLGSSQLSCPGQSLSFIETTEVKFRNLSKMEIEQYVATNEPLDKAGAYGIQGLAKKFVENIQGSYSNVVGLPIERLQTELEKIIPQNELSLLKSAQKYETN